MHRNYLLQLIPNRCILEWLETASSSSFEIDCRSVRDVYIYLDVTT